MSKDKCVGEYMEQQMAITMALCSLLIEKEVFTPKEFNNRVLRMVSDLDQELAKPFIKDD